MKSIALLAALGLTGLLGSQVLAQTTQPPAPGEDAQSAATQPAEQPTSAKGKTYIIGLCQPNALEPWRLQMIADINAAAAKHDNIKVFSKDAENDADTQKDQIEEFIKQKVDLLMISPKDSWGFAGVVGKAMDAGIPVILLDRVVTGDKYTCFVTGDNFASAKAAGQYVAKVLNGKGKVAELMGLQTSPPGQERHKGFVAGLGGNLGPGKIEIVYSTDCVWMEEKAQKAMQEALAKVPDVDLVFAHNDPMAHGAWVAARDKGDGLEKKIKFVGLDALPYEGIQYVKQGILTATVSYPTGGAEAVDAAIEILGGHKVPKKIVAASVLYTPENVKKGGQLVKPDTDARTRFDVILKTAGERKISVIKAVRALTDLGLKDAKDLVDAAPSTIKAGVPRQDAEEAKRQLEAAGATVEIK